MVTLVSMVTTVTIGAEVTIFLGGYPLLSGFTTYLN